MKAHVRSSEPIPTAISKNLFRKIAKEATKFEDPKIVIDINVDDLEQLQQFANRIRNQLDKLRIVKTRYPDMRLNVLFNDDNITTNSVIDIINNIPDNMCDEGQKVAHVVSSNMYYINRGIKILPDANSKKNNGNNYAITHVALNNPVYMMATTHESTLEVESFYDISPEQFDKIPVNKTVCSIFGASDGKDHGKDIDKVYRNNEGAYFIAAMLDIGIILSIIKNELPKILIASILKPIGDNHYVMDLRTEPDITSATLKLTESIIKNGFGHGIISNTHLNNNIDDEIILDDDAIDKLISLWRGDDYEYAPSDLLDDGTVPMVGCCIKNGTMSYKIVVASSELADIPISGAGAIDIIYPSGTIKSLVIMRYEGQLMIDPPSDEAVRILKAWYAIQLSLLNPVIKERCEKIAESVDGVQMENVSTHRSNKKTSQKRIRHYYNLIGDNVTKIIDGDCRHNHRHTMSWYVIGHWRTYKDGHQTFIKGHWRGPLRAAKSSSELREREIDT